MKKIALVAATVVIGIGALHFAPSKFQKFVPAKLRGQPSQWRGDWYQHCVNIELLSREEVTTDGPEPHHQACKLTIRNTVENTFLTKVFSTCQPFPEGYAWADISMPGDVLPMKPEWDELYSKINFLKEDDCNFNAAAKIKDVREKVATIKIGGPTDQFKTVFPGTVPLFAGPIADRMMVRIDPGIEITFPTRRNATYEQETIPLAISGPISVKIDPWTDRECEMWNGNWVPAKVGRPSPTGETRVCQIPNASKYETAN